MDRPSHSDPGHAQFGQFQGDIDHGSESDRTSASSHNLGRNLRVLKLLAYLGASLQAGMFISEELECVGGPPQHFSSSTSMTHMGLLAPQSQAAHFLPGKIVVGSGKVPVWMFATNPKVRNEIEDLFCQVEHRPVSFNQADTAAEAKGKPEGLCAALVAACNTLFSQLQVSRPLAGHAPTGSPKLAHVPRPGWLTGTDFELPSQRVPRPNSPAAKISDLLITWRGQESSGLTGLKLLPLTVLGNSWSVWHEKALLGFRNAIAKKQDKPGLPPLVGDRFEGYSPESITARSTARNTLHNREASLKILEYYLQDQQRRSWKWIEEDGLCKSELELVQANCKEHAEP